MLKEEEFHPASYFDGPAIKSGRHSRLSTKMTFHFISMHFIVNKMSVTIVTPFIKILLCCSILSKDKPNQSIPDMLTYVYFTDTEFAY